MGDGGPHELPVTTSACETTPTVDSRQAGARRAADAPRPARARTARSVRAATRSAVDRAARAHRASARRRDDRARVERASAPGAVSPSNATHGRRAAARASATSPSTASRSPRSGRAAAPARPAPRPSSPAPRHEGPPSIDHADRLQSSTRTTQASPSTSDARHREARPSSVGAARTGRWDATCAARRCVVAAPSRCLRLPRDPCQPPAGDGEAASRASMRTIDCGVPPAV